MPSLEVKSHCILSGAVKKIKGAQTPGRAAPGDKISAGTSLCEGSISPVDILRILGPNKVREYLVNEIQEVYRLQGSKN